jgi:hypothetical protein
VKLRTGARADAIESFHKKTVLSLLSQNTLPGNHSRKSIFIYTVEDDLYSNGGPMSKFILVVKGSPRENGNSNTLAEQLEMGAK